jgi:hypothetical protein
MRKILQALALGAALLTGPRALAGESICDQMARGAYDAGPLMEKTFKSDCAKYGCSGVDTLTRAQRDARIAWVYHQSEEEEKCPQYHGPLIVHP